MNNTTASFLDQDECLHDGENKFRVKGMVVFTIVALATYFGNILILVTLNKFSNYLKGTLYILLGNLAAADLFLAVGLTFQIIGLIFTQMKSDSSFCVVKSCILGVSVTASGILLMHISVDRFCAIVFPMKHLVFSTKHRRRKIKLVLVWFLSITVICVPVISKYSLGTENSACNSCNMIPKGISLAAAVFIPVQFIINVVMCLIVIWRLKTNTMSEHKYKKSVTKCGLLIKVYVAFAISWTPFVVTTILMETSDEEEKYMAVREYAIVPGLMNSAMNWIIYGLANKKLRDLFKNVLLCRKQGQLHLTNYIQSNNIDKRESNITNEQFQPCETSA